MGTKNTIKDLMQEHKDSKSGKVVIEFTESDDGKGASYSVEGNNISSDVVIGASIALIQAITENVFDGDKAQALAIITMGVMMDRNE